MPDSEVRWYLFAEGQSYGPYTEEQLHKFVLGGQATGDTRVSVVGSQEWVLLAQALPGLFQDALPPAAPPMEPIQPSRRPPIVVEARLRTPVARSYVGFAVITLILYWVGFWIIGLIANIVFLSQARQEERASGMTPDGKGCLTALIWVFAWIPLVVGLLILFLSAGSSYHHR